MVKCESLRINMLPTNTRKNQYIFSWQFESSRLVIGLKWTSDQKTRIHFIVAFIPKLFLRVFAPIFTHPLFLILINIVTIFSGPKILFHVILWESQSELCTKNATNSANKFYIAALNFPKSVQLFKYNPFVPKFRMPILNFAPN